MKNVLMSFEPELVAKILNGEKTLEVRTVIPKCDLPCKVYMYCIISGATKNCHIDSKGRKNLLMDYSWDSIGEITLYSKGRRQLGEHTTHCFNYGKVLNGKVVAEFVCNKIQDIYDAVDDAVNVQEFSYWNDYELNKACMHQEDMLEYGKNGKLFGLHIDDLKIYDKPKELSEFHKQFELDNEGFIKCGNECTNIKGFKCTWNECETLQSLYPKLKKAPQNFVYVEELE